ncbi:hypothetical protein BG000_010348 [Podila horticola]|nr:hypothetical protein BG000_010348 [Podila horticola]
MNEPHHNYGHVSTVSIFDIALIVDAIGLSLSFRDAQACRLVHRQWASMFKPHLWRAIKLPSTITMVDDNVEMVLMNKSWIRSLTLAAQHIEIVSNLDLTALQELILYDENFEEAYVGVPVKVDPVIAMIDNNNNLSTLEIDLNCYHYEPRTLCTALMLAIYRHPSLTKLVWNVPFRLQSHEFTMCLLNACHKSIQELRVINKSFIICQGTTTDYGTSSCHVFEYEEFVGQEKYPEYKVLRQRLEVPMGQWEPFQFRSLYLNIGDNTHYDPILRNSPSLQEVAIDLYNPDVSKVPELLAGCSMLRGLNLEVRGFYRDFYADTVRRLSHLQTVRLPLDKLTKEYFDQIMSMLIESSLHTLEALGFDGKAPVRDVMSVLRKFPNLKQVDCRFVRIYRGTDEGPSRRMYIRES